ncbi:MAG: glycerol-3-phosphate dehydrogenase/oxidase [Bryobacteraceae bacterium]
MSAAFELDSRARNLEQLGRDTFDLLIIGGGINGAGIARDLALRAEVAGRPLRIALIDKAHFSSGTSGRNSQLIHGGLRYLKNFELDLVREALHERATLLRIAPHLVDPLPLILPFYSRLDRFYYGAGLFLYDLLAGEYDMGGHRYLSRAQLAAVEPGMAGDGLHSAAIFHDCRVHSARLLLENIFAAARSGAVIANYVEAGAPRGVEGSFTVPATDRLGGRTFEIRARRIVDARGPWVGGPNLRLVRGSHIIVPRATASENAVAYFGPDGRIIFVIPWGPDKSLSLVGTTDIDHSSTPDDVRISPDEIAYLRNVLKRLFPSGGEFEPLAAYSSLRPLVATPGANATDTSRSHKITLNEGVLEISGGKYTTYRAMAEEAVDLLYPEWTGACRTAEIPLGPGPEEAARLAAPVAWAVNHEMAQRLSDVMFISTYLGHERTLTRDYLRPIAAEIAALLRWDEPRIQQEIEAALAKARVPG